MNESEDIRVLKEILDRAPFHTPFDFIYNNPDHYFAYMRDFQELIEQRRRRELSIVFKVKPEDKKDAAIKFIEFWYYFDGDLLFLLDLVEGEKKEREMPVPFIPGELPLLIELHNLTTDDPTDSGHKKLTMTRAVKKMEIDKKLPMSEFSLLKRYQSSEFGKVKEQIDPLIELGQLKAKILAWHFASSIEKGVDIKDCYDTPFGKLLNQKYPTM